MDAIRLLGTLGLQAWLLAVTLDGTNAQSAGPAADSPVPTRITKRADFGIPFQLSPGHPRGIVEIQLYVSSNLGTDWQLADRQRPGSTGFQFRAPQDGEYWFSVTTVEAGSTGSAHQPRQPELKVVVDTEQPQLELRANVAASGEVSVRWRAHDLNLAPESFRLQYQPQEDRWQDVYIRAAEQQTQLQTWEGEVQFWIRPEAGKAILRASIRDGAGNTTLVEKRATAGDALKPDATFQNWEQGPNPKHSGDRTAGQLRSGDDGFRREDGRRAGGNSPFADFGSPPQDTGAARTTPLTRHDAWRSTNDRAPTSSWPRPTSNLDGESQVFRPVSNDFEGANPTDHLSARPRIVSSPNFQLDYDLFGVGPRGPRAVELWITRDRGLTWELHGSDPDRVSPILVELSREGLYGFRLAVHGFEGDPEPTPPDGADADTWVGVDWTKPVGKITHAGFLTDAPPVLSIEWTAADAMLADEPITLSYSANGVGGWEPIATDLRNSGSYRWEVHGRLPDPVYLRLEIRDLAGNVTSEIYQTPVSPRQQSPSGRIRDVRPLRRTAFGASFVR